MISYPDWFKNLVDRPVPTQESDRVVLAGVPMRLTDGLLRDERCLDDKQTRTRATFAFKWTREESHGSSATLDIASLLVEDFGITVMATRS